MLSEILAKPIKIVDEKSAIDQVQQWKDQGIKCDNFQLSAESFNLLHLMSLVQVYEDLSKIGEKCLAGTNKSIKKWVIKFIRDGLNIGRKMKQKNQTLI